MSKTSIRLILLLILALLISLFFIPFIVYKHPDGSTTPLSSIVPSGMSPHFFVYLFGLNCSLILIIVLSLILRNNLKLQIGLSAVSVFVSLLFYLIFLFYAFLEAEKTTDVGYGIGFYIPIIITLLSGLVYYKIKRKK